MGKSQTFDHQTKASSKISIALEANYNVIIEPRQEEVKELCKAQLVAF